MRFLPKSYQGIAYMIASMLFFSLMNNCIRHTLHEIPSTQLAFLRNLFSILIMTGWIMAFHSPSMFRPTRLKSHLSRAVVGIISLELWFYSLGAMPLNAATALSFTSPVFGTILAILFLKEQATFARWCAILLGFLGMLVILRPDQHLYTLPALLVLCSALLMAIGGTLIKSLTRNEHPDKIVFFQSLLMASMALPAALYYWQPLTLYAAGWTLLVTIFSLAAHLCLTRAFSHSDMILLMPFDFMRLVFTALFAWLWFDEKLEIQTAFGACLIVAGSVWSATASNPDVRKLLLRITLRRTL